MTIIYCIVALILFYIYYYFLESGEPEPPNNDECANIYDVTPKYLPLL